MTTPPDPKALRSAVRNAALLKDRARPVPQADFDTLKDALVWALNEVVESVGPRPDLSGNEKRRRTRLAIALLAALRETTLHERERTYGDYSH